MYRFGVVDLRWDWHALRAKCATCKLKRGAAGVVEDRLPTSASRFDGFDETLSNGAMCYCTLGHLLCTWWKLSAAELMGTLSGATSRQKRALTDDTADLLAAPDDLKRSACTFASLLDSSDREPTWLLRSGHIL
ncbi:MAG: hypothetical protein MHM6MM_006732 [Cercozoa sp. M6MM]